MRKLKDVFIEYNPEVGIPENSNLMEFITSKDIRESCYPLLGKCVVCKNTCKIHGANRLEKFVCYDFRREE